jgi:hypothetical protein
VTPASRCRVWAAVHRATSTSKPKLSRIILPHGVVGVLKHRVHLEPVAGQAVGFDTLNHHKPGRRLPRPPRTKINNQNPLAELRNDQVDPEESSNAAKPIRT